MALITDIDGVRIGHWTDEPGRTGCTVIVFPDGTVASGEVRGGAPATREFALLDPSRMMTRIDAVVLTGGSAFGLAAADGVMAALAEDGRGFPTPGGVVPIVVGLGLYDLTEGEPGIRPDAAAGRAALLASTAPDVPVAGRIGAGTGATMGKLRGPDHRQDGGLVHAAVATEDGLVVAALVAVNAVGAPGVAPADVIGDATVDVFGNTTIGVVVTNAPLSKGDCLLVAQSAHDGLARALVPAHTAADGDAFVAAATGGWTPPDADDGQLRDMQLLGRIRSMAVVAVVEAIESLVGG